jgi:hypothetical protein
MAEDKPQVLFDLNIALDVLQERKDFYDFSARLLAFAETDTIQGWLAAQAVNAAGARMNEITSRGFALHNASMYKFATIL